MRKRLNLIVLFLLAALIIWWFGHGLDWAEVKQAIWQADGRLLITAVILSCLVYVLGACRCKALLAPFALVRWWDAFVAAIIGIAAVFVAGRAGEGVRALMITSRDRRVRPSASLITVVLERLCDVVAVLFLFALNLLWLRAPGGREGTFAHLRLIGAVLVVGALGGVVCLVLFQRHSSAIISWLGRQGRHWPRPLDYLRRVFIRLLEQLASSLNLLANLRELIIVVSWTALIWAMNCIATWLVLRAFGLPFGLSATFFVMGWTLVGSLVPTPGGAAGAYHAATAAGLIVLGAGREQAAAVSIVLHLIAYTPALIIALYFLITGLVTPGSLLQLGEVRPVVSELK